MAIGCYDSTVSRTVKPPPNKRAGYFDGFRLATGNTESTERRFCRGGKRDEGRSCRAANSCPDFIDSGLRCYLQI